MVIQTVIGGLNILRPKIPGLADLARPPLFDIVKQRKSSKTSKVCQLKENIWSFQHDRTDYLLMYVPNHV